MGLIAGRYQLLEASRPGAPQRARDLQSAQTVLLRDVVLTSARAPEAIERARAAQGICHPSLVTLFDVVPQPDGHVLLAYEFVVAQSLLHVAGGQPFHARRAAGIVAEVADAVAELHARGLAHGGISQETVLVTMKGKAKLDRVADPSLGARIAPTVDGDIAAMGDLLRDLAGRPAASGVPGQQAIETLVERTRRRGFDSAAVFAAMLRRI